MATQGIREVVIGHPSMLVRILIALLMVDCLDAANRNRRYLAVPYRRRRKSGHEAGRIEVVILVQAGVLELVKPKVQLMDEPGRKDMGVAGRVMLDIVAHQVIVAELSVPALSDGLVTLWAG
jgi:hypothetical protein